MFVRYLGGGIGHLEQFPPADGDDRVMYEYEDDEGSDGVGDAVEVGGDQGDEDDEDGEDEDEEGDGDGYSDLGESSDEDMGNTY